MDIESSADQSAALRHVVRPNSPGVRSLSWTPDGKHLVFVFGFDLIDENQPPPTENYVYTPPGM